MNEKSANKVLVTPHLIQTNEGSHFGPLVKAGFEVVYPPDGVNTLEKEIIVSLLSEDVVAMIASTEPMTRDVLAGSSLRVVARFGVGFDSVDVQAATDLGIAVTITPGTLEDSVAEQTLALLLGLTRDVIGRDQEVRAGDWKRTPLPRLSGKTIGLVGLGRIGQAVIPRVKGLGMRVIGFDPFLSDDVRRTIGVDITSDLDSLLESSDVLSLHLPCTAQTENLIDAEALDRMKADAILINTSRGGLVDEDALCSTLDRGHLFGVGLDVFREEPLATDSRLLSFPNVLTSTHVGGIDLETTRLAGELTARCICDLSRNEWPEGYVVNQELKTNWSWSPKTS